MTDFDGPWKEALEHGFDLFLALLFPDVHASLDWSADHASLDQELQKLVPEAATGVRRVDKLVKAARRDTGDPRYLHVEAQMQPDDDFGRRMYTYSYRGRDRFNQPLLSLAVLGDDNPRWHPRSYREGELGCETVYTFRTAKLLEWAGRAEELERHENLFALFVLAHLQALATRDDEDARQGWKLRLLANLAGRQLTDLEAGLWYRLIDWLLPLPAERDRQVWEQIFQRRKEPEMTFITFAERYGMEKGLKEGFEKGEKAGLEKGEKAGLEKGEKAGLEKGERKGLLDALRILLETRFGSEGASLAATLDEQADAARLQALLRAAGAAGSLDEVRQLLR
jgi:hypothetical protein